MPEFHIDLNCKSATDSKIEQIRQIYIYFHAFNEFLSFHDTRSKHRRNEKIVAFNGFQILKKSVTGRLIHGNGSRKRDSLGVVRKRSLFSSVPQLDWIEK